MVILYELARVKIYLDNIPVQQCQQLTVMFSLVIVVFWPQGLVVESLVEGVLYCSVDGGLLDFHWFDFKHLCV